MILDVGGEVLAAGGAAGVASLSKGQELPPCQTELIPGSSNGPTAGYG